MPLLLKREDKPRQKRIVPLIPLREGVVFPYTESVLTFGRPQSKSAIDSAFRTDRLLCFVSQKDPRVDNPEAKDIYTVGTLCTLKRVLKTETEINALAKGLVRVKIEEIKAGDQFLLAVISEIPEETIRPSEKIEALTKHLASQLKKAVSLGKAVDFLTYMRLVSGVSPAELTDQIASILDIDTAKKQQLLETFDITSRLESVIDYFSHEIRVAEIEQKINTKTQKKFDKSMRETVLRERMRTIQRELGEKEEDKETAELRQKIKEAKMPKEVEEKANKELSRLSKMHAYNPESGYIRTYLEWLIDIPWGKETANNVSIKNAAKVLQNDHYGLDEVKERVLEYLAVMKLKKEKKKTDDQSAPTILCFVGPPGVGKTSIGRSIAKALERKFVKISLGGIRDEAEIRGHRRTYVGALPGRIIQGIKSAQTNNPVFMLDEIDKVGADFRGDPSAALLEALDPEQNKEFSDHYLEVAFDLSKVMFITTANILDTIPPALRDRLEVIRFSGYTQDEKLEIAKRFLTKKVLKANGLDNQQIDIPLSVLSRIIEAYTREAGVRNLEREISKVMRKVARQVAENAGKNVGKNVGKNKKKKVMINLKNLSDYLGPRRFSRSLAEKKDEVGVSTGLAWTQAGGEILFIETVLMPGKGTLTLTGQLGDVMKESCQAALSYMRSHWQELKIGKDISKKTDIHIHVPEGAVPKDGPSAGIAIATSLISAFTNRKVKKDVGLTGEITLRGKVLEIGGIKEKVIAAHRAGIKKIILPKDNKKDLVKVPAKIKKDIQFVFVDQVAKALNEALISPGVTPGS